MARKKTQEEREELLAEIQKAYEERPARLAADPAEWVEFIERVAQFGAK